MPKEIAILDAFCPAQMHLCVYMLEWLILFKKEATTCVPDKQTKKASYLAAHGRQSSRISTSLFLLYFQNDPRFLSYCVRIVGEPAYIITMFCFGVSGPPGTTPSSTLSLRPKPPAASCSRFFLRE